MDTCPSGAMKRYLRQKNPSVLWRKIADATVDHLWECLVLGDGAGPSFESKNAHRNGFIDQWVTLYLSQTWTYRPTIVRRAVKRARRRWQGLLDGKVTPFLEGIIVPASPQGEPSTARGETP